MYCSDIREFYLAVAIGFARYEIELTFQADQSDTSATDVRGRQFDFYDGCFERSRIDRRIFFRRPGDVDVAAQMFCGRQGQPEIIAALKPVDASQAPGRRYGTTPPEKLTFVEETLSSTPSKKLNFYDLLYDSLRKGKPLLATPESARRTMEVLRMARKGTKFT